MAVAGIGIEIARARGVLGGSSQPLGVLEIRLAGGRVVELAPALEQPNSLSLSSDGKELAVARDRRSDASDLRRPCRQHGSNDPAVLRV
jgi:hypothetical protein